MAVGMDTLDLFRIHEGTLAGLGLLGGRNAMIKRAERFFAEALTPIEMTHRAALAADARLAQLKKTLGRRTVELAASRRLLAAGVTRRQAMDRALKRSAVRYARLVKESRDLQDHLRHLAHRMLSAQETQRTKISRKLHDEVAQTLLGINVRLLTLKREAAADVVGLKDEIARTQRLVDTSATAVSRFAREFGSRYDR